MLLRQSERGQHAGILSFSHMGPRDQTQVASLGSKSLYPPAQSPHQPTSSTVWVLVLTMVLIICMVCTYVSVYMDTYTCMKTHVCTEPFSLSLSSLAGLLAGTRMRSVASALGPLHWFLRGLRCSFLFYLLLLPSLGCSLPLVSGAALETPGLPVVWFLATRSHLAQAGLNLTM